MRNGISQTEKVEIIGLDEAIRAFRNVPRVVERRVLTVAVRKAATIIRRSAIQRAPRGETLVLRRSIRMRRVRTPQKYGRVRMHVGPTGRGFYGRFLAQGWKHNMTGQTVRPRRTRLWLTRAFSAVRRPAQGALFQAIIDRLPVEVEREARRVGAVRGR